MNLVEERTTKKQEQAYSNINTRSFVVIAVLLLAILVFCGSLSYFIPQGSFATDASNNIIPGTYEKGQVEGIAIWRVLTAPIRVFASEDAATIIMISVFLLIMSGVFNLLDKTNGIKTFIHYIMERLRGQGGLVVCIIVLIFRVDVYI